MLIKIKFSSYADSKFLGENKIREIFPTSLIVRPGVVFEKEIILLTFFHFWRNLVLFFQL